MHLYLHFKWALHNIMMNSKIHANNFNFLFSQNDIKYQIKSTMTNWKRKTAQEEKKALYFRTFNSIFFPAVLTGAPYFNFALSSTVYVASPDYIHLRVEIVVLLLFTDSPFHSFDKYSALAMYKKCAKGWEYGNEQNRHSLYPIEPHSLLFLLEIYLCFMF